MLLAYVDQEPYFDQHRQGASFGFKNQYPIIHSTLGRMGKAFSASAESLVHMFAPRRKHEIELADVPTAMPLIYSPSGPSGRHSDQPIRKTYSGKFIRLPVNETEENAALDRKLASEKEFVNNLAKENADALKPLAREDTPFPRRPSAPFPSSPTFGSNETIVSADIKPWPSK